MIYTINLKDLTEKINPLTFAKYLTSTGWTSFPTKKDYIKIFQYKLKGDDFYQIIIPIDRTLSDYKIAMYNAIETVSAVEKQSTEQLMLYLLNPNTDILKIRLDNNNIETGSITIDDGIRIYENAKKLLVATAQDIINPKRYHQGRIDDTVSKFIDSCRFGQTEIGSYVVSIVCPFAEIDKQKSFRQLSIFSDEEQCAYSLTRQVTNRLMTNIASIKASIDSGDYTNLATPSENTIISANFFEALMGLNLNSEGTNLEFIAQWSPSVKINRTSKSKIALSYDYCQPISDTINKLKETKKEAVKIVGRIKKLESSPELETRTSGKITVVYLDENGNKKSSVASLSREDYLNAIKAHTEGNYVEITGEFSGQKNKILNCESFSVIE